MFFQNFVTEVKDMPYTRMRSIFIQPLPGPGLIQCYFIVQEGYARSGTHVRLPQKCLIPSAYPIFGAPQAPRNELKQTKWVLCGKPLVARRLVPTQCER